MFGLDTRYRRLLDFCETYSIICNIEENSYGCDIIEVEYNGKGYKEAIFDIDNDNYKMKNYMLIANIARILDIKLDKGVNNE